MSNLYATKDTDYSLWKATKEMKKQRAYVPPFRKEDGSWALCDQDKAETFARHLGHAFQPKNITSELVIEQCQPLNEICENIKFFTPIKISNEIDTNINLKKAPEYYHGNLERRCWIRGLLRSQQSR